MTDSKTTIVIVLPGTTGTALVHYKALGSIKINPVWIGQVAELIEAGNIDGATALLNMPGVQQDPDLSDPTTLVPWRPMVGPLGQSGYAPLFDYLARHLKSGVTPAQHMTWNLEPKNQKIPVVGTPGATANLVIGFGYDWRADNGWTGTKKLKQLLAAIKDAYVEAGRSYRVVLVAHSMGGLVSRAYLESEAFDPTHGVEALITLGTPHLGAPLALDPITGGPVIPSIPDAVIDSLANNAEFPSTYELLPPPGKPEFAADGVTRTGGFVFDESAGGAVVDIYPDQGRFSEMLVDGAPQGFGASKPNLLAAQSFTTGLTGTPPEGVRYYAAYGLANTVKLGKRSLPGTVTSYDWTPGAVAAGSINAVRTDYAPLDGDGVPTNVWTGGDGIVPVWSAKFHGNTAVTSAAIKDCDHLQMPGSDAMHDCIGTWLDMIMAGASAQAPLAA